MIPGLREVPESSQSNALVRLGLGLGLGLVETRLQTGRTAFSFVLLTFNC